MNFGRADGSAGVGDDGGVAADRACCPAEADEAGKAGEEVEIGGAHCGPFVAAVVVF